MPYFFDCDRIRLRRRSKRYGLNRQFHWQVPNHVKCDIKQDRRGWIIDGQFFGAWHSPTGARFAKCQNCGDNTQVLWRPNNQILWKCDKCWRVFAKLRDCGVKRTRTAKYVARTPLCRLQKDGYTLENLIHTGLMEVV